MGEKINCESREVSGCHCVPEGTNNTMHTIILNACCFYHPPQKEPFENKLQNSLEAVNQLYFNRFRCRQHGAVLVLMLVNRVASGH